MAWGAHRVSPCQGAAKVAFDAESNISRFRPDDVARPRVTLLTATSLTSPRGARVRFAAHAVVYPSARAISSGRLRFLGVRLTRNTSRKP